MFFVGPQADRSFGGKKPSSSANEGPSLVELSGYNPKRQEFDPEYDNDAEQLLAEMEFKDTDTEEEREIKLRVLRIYSKRYVVSIIWPSHLLADSFIWIFETCKT